MRFSSLLRNASFVAAVAAGLGVAMLLAQPQPPAVAPGKAAPKGSVQGRLSWLDRKGKAVGTVGEPGLYRTLTISPDAKRVAVERADPQTQNRDIWLIDISGGKQTRFTTDPGFDAFPLWSPDGTRLVFTSNRGGGSYDLYQKSVTGSAPEELLYKSTEGKGPTSWSPDGRFLLFYSLGQPTHVRLLAASGAADRAPIPMIDPQFSSITPRFSHDGRWIAYTSSESGGNELAVRPFDSAAGAAGKPVFITKGGGRTPLWRGDGKELYYYDDAGMGWSVEVNTRSGFHASTPKPLFKLPSAVAFWDVTPDGKRFLLPVPER